MSGEIVLKKLKKTDLKLIRNLEKRNQDPYYISSSDQTWNNILFQEDSLCIGCFIDNKLIAYSSAFILKRSSYRDFFVKYYKINEDKTLFLNNTLVDKKYRGKGLQLKMRKETITQNQYRGFNVITTVSKNNISSNRTIIKLGLDFFNEGYAPYSKDLKVFYKGKIK